MPDRRSSFIVRLPTRILSVLHAGDPIGSGASFAVCRLPHESAPCEERGEAPSTRSAPVGGAAGDPLADQDQDEPSRSSLSTCSARISPIARELVAAGDGAFAT